MQGEVNYVYYCFYESESGKLKEYKSLTEEYGVDRKRRIFYNLELSRIIKLYMTVFLKGKRKYGQA